MKDPRAVTSNDLSERRLVFRACETRQFEVDRKSTRLNSSHDQISYAVFCLKYPPTPEIYTLSLHDALPICALQSSLVARTLSKKFPARLLRPNYARERIGTQHERPAGCNVERSQRTQTRLPRVRDAPVRGQTLVRNRSTKALVSLSFVISYSELVILKSQILRLPIGKTPAR